MSGYVSSEGDYGNSWYLSSENEEGDYGNSYGSTAEEPLSSDDSVFESHELNYQNKSAAKTLKGQYRAIVAGYRIQSNKRLTRLQPENLIKNQKGSYVSTKRHLSGKKIANDPASFVYQKNLAYKNGLETFEWTNKRGERYTYKSLGRYGNGTLMPIYKKIKESLVLKEGNI